MKRILVGLLIGVAAVSVRANDQTLLDETDAWKMYTRPELSLTDIGGHTATLGSLSVGWMLNDKLSLGPSATVSLRAINDSDNGNIDRFDLWYAGLRAEYTIRSSDLVHASVSAFIGGGDMAVQLPGSRDDTGGLVVFEPGVNVGVNAWDWVELGVGVGYRFVESVHVGGYNGKDLEDWNLSVFARFTEF
jgi:hypothetical protein